MELIKKQVHYTQEGKRTFDQFYLDEDYNVPDAKEDVQQISSWLRITYVFPVNYISRYSTLLLQETRSPRFWKAKFHLKRWCIQMAEKWKAISYRISV